MRMHKQQLTHYASHTMWYYTVSHWKYVCLCNPSGKGNTLRAYDHFMCSTVFNFEITNCIPIAHAPYACLQNEVHAFKHDARLTSTALPNEALIRPPAAPGGIKHM